MSGFARSTCTRSPRPVRSLRPDRCRQPRRVGLLPTCTRPPRSQRSFTLLPTIADPAPAATIQAVISLITASGLGLGQALGLDRADVDLENVVLVVTGKNDRTWMVRLHSTTVAMFAGIPSPTSKPPSRHADARTTNGYLHTGDDEKAAGISKPPGKPIQTASAAKPPASTHRRSNERTA